MVHFFLKFTFTFSASCLLILEEAWNRINGHFFNDNKTEIIPWVDRVSWRGSQDRPYKTKYKIKNRCYYYKYYDYFAHKMEYWVKKDVELLLSNRHNILALLVQLLGYHFLQLSWCQFLKLYYWNLKKLHLLEYQYIVNGHNNNTYFIYLHI